MSTIRPLATIAVLAALGVFLAFKINEGPPVALSDEWADAASESEGGAPPAWPGDNASPAAVPAPAFNQPSGASLEARSAPSWAESNASEAPTAPSAPQAPAFPAMPQLPNDTSASATPSGASNEQLSLPASIPQANYGDASADKPSISGRVPSLGSSTPDLPSQPVGAPGFDAAWQAIQTALEVDQLPRAHRILSQWRNEPKLSYEQKQKVDALLSQLAGTVIYSTESLLEPAYIVKPGETLVSIAQQYSVPWQLLAKINGVASVDGVQPGQSLKVIRGPFEAEVDLASGELVLLIDDRYAGKFPVRVEGQGPTDGMWRVGQKRIDPSTPTADPTQPTVVLESNSGEQVELSAGVSPPAGARGRLAVASADMADLFDILSVGSPVTVRR